MKIFLLFDIIGINESKLIFNPIQALNLEFDEIAIKILNSSVESAQDRNYWRALVNATFNPSIP